jgi:hypothetical protein
MPYFRNTILVVVLASLCGCTFFRSLSGASGSELFQKKKTCADLIDRVEKKLAEEEKAELAMGFKLYEMQMAKIMIYKIRLAKVCYSQARNSCLAFAEHIWAIDRSDNRGTNFEMIVHDIMTNEEIKKFGAKMANEKELAKYQKDKKQSFSECSE